MRTTASALKARPPAWYWIVAILGIIWALLNVLAVVGEYLPQSFAGIAKENAPFPLTVNVLYRTSIVLAVGTCLIAEVGLLRRRSWSVQIFAASLAISLLGFALRYGYGALFAPPEWAYLITVPYLVFNGVVLSGRILLLWFSVASRDRGWIAEGAAAT